MPVRVSYRSNQVHPCWGDPCPHSSHFASPKNVFRGRTMAFCGCYVPKWRGEKSIPNVGVSWIEWLKILLFFCGGLDISVVELLTRTVYCCRTSQRNRLKISNDFDDLTQAHSPSIFIGVDIFLFTFLF